MIENNMENAAIRKEYIQFKWLDQIKAVALIWIFLNHVVERLFGYPLIANPFYDWPALSDRVAQLKPLIDYGAWNIPINAVRYIGWFGDQGVQLFLIISGFGLTWGLLTRKQGKSIKLWPFYLRRAERIYPLWWGAHLFFAATWFLVGWGISVTEPAFWASLVGIRVTPGLLYYFAPAWWYIGLILQLYLIYPLLWRLLNRWGPARFLIIGCLIGFIARTAGLLYFDTYLDAWLRGAIFLTRLPEFIFGMSLALWLQLNPQRTEQVLRSPSVVILAIVGYLLGTLLALTLLGMAAAPFLLGISAFILLYALFTSRLFVHLKGAGIGSWLSRHTYSIFIMHNPFIIALVPLGLSASKLRIFGGIAAAIFVTVVAALMLEFTVGKSLVLLKRWVQRSGFIRVGVRLGILLVVVLGLAASVEMAVRLLNPQEVLGWGERPSLQMDETLGWRLIPSQTTQLRWESYDYWVESNSLGFPGPEYPAAKKDNTFRIMTVGDAFTSAEGVNTEQAWPRLLEQRLSAQHPESDIEVMNFAITGFGPNQYAAVVEKYATLYKPDLILIGFFVNEYLDVLWSNEEFQNSIGFQLQPQDGWYSLVRLSHLQKLVQLEIKEPLLERLKQEPRNHGYFLGHFSTLEKDQIVSDSEAVELVAQRLEEIQSVAETIGSDLAVVMIPSSVQVCRPDELDYYPRYIDLSDTTAYDLDQPQRVTAELAKALDIPYIDLLPVLQTGDEACPYQSGNMHWTPLGHQIVADFLSEVVDIDNSVESQ